MCQKKFLYSTVLLPYLTVLLLYFDRTCALFTAYFRRTLIVLLPHLETYCNRTPAVFPCTVCNHKRLVGVFASFYGDREQCWRVGCKAWKELQCVNCYRLNSDNFYDRASSEIICYSSGQNKVPIFNSYYGRRTCQPLPY